MLFMTAGLSEQVARHTILYRFDAPEEVCVRAKSVLQVGALVLLVACAMGAGADDKSEYERRSAARYVSLFHSLDRNADGAVTQSEARGDLNFGPRFDDMDINRDEIVTTPEFQRFIEQEHGVRATRLQR